jgi:hypothetical protein
LALALVLVLILVLVLVLTEFVAGAGAAAAIEALSTLAAAIAVTVCGDCACLSCVDPPLDARGEGIGCVLRRAAAVAIHCVLACGPTALPPSR